MNSHVPKIDSMPIECIIVDDDRLSIQILKSLVEKTQSLTLLETFEDPIQAIKYINTHDIDLIFLDVEMPGMTGLELLKALKTSPDIILISAKRDYALDAFDFNVIDFLLKPLTYPRFTQAIEKVLHKKEQETAPVEFRGNFVFVKSDSVLIKLDIREIYWVEALADYIAMVTPNKKYVCHSTMKAIEAKLPSSQFMRIHRSYIVRIDKIDAIEDNTVVIDGKLIPVGGTYRERLMRGLDFI